MKAKTKYLEIGKDILGKEEEHLLISVEPCKKYDQVNQRTTDEIEGYRYTIFIAPLIKGASLTNITDIPMYDCY